MSVLSPLAIAGPVGIRRGILEAVCEEDVGHEHNYDHLTIVLTGRLKVFYAFLQDGEAVEGESKAFSAGETVVILANVRHRLKALEQGTTYLCVFSHRDFDGLVTQAYEGNNSAFQ